LEGVTSLLKENKMDNLTSDQIQFLRSVLKEISGHKSIIEQQRNYINDGLSRVEEELEIPKKVTRKLATVYHAQTFLEAQEENDNFQLFLEVLK
jgi:hypothetical protein